MEKKDIPLFFDQYPGTPRSCRKRQRFSLPRNTPLVLHPFPKNQKEGVNLPFLKRRKVEKKTYHCFLSDILALLRVTGNAYVLLLLKVLRLFYICFFKTKQRLNLPFLKSRRESHTLYHFTLTSILVFLSIAGSLDVLFFISVLGSQRSTVMKRKDVEDSTSNLYQANGGFFLSPN